MLESDWLPNNVMKFQRYIHYIVNHHKEGERGEGRGEEMEKGRKREGGEERRMGGREGGGGGGGERREERRGGRGKGRGGEEEEEESTYSLYCHNVSLSLQ